MNELRVSSRVVAELAEAVDWHERQHTGRGDELEAIVGAAIEEIAQWPERWPLWRSDGPYRRRVLLDVPYAIFYVFDGGIVEILAVAHTRRLPGYWLKK